MKVPNTPYNEEARLETLRSFNILDTRAEERFDRLTRIAKRLFVVPIALVTLVDENRQWFKSCIGLSVRETERDISFCGHAILGDDPFIVPDTTADERFADNPLVLNDPYIRFYAGCPIKAPDGHKLGTLCVIDHEPRDFGKEELRDLIDLAAMVEHEIATVQLATMDELTDIPNRRGFMMLAQHSLNLCIQQKLPASLVFIDLDNFKQINDTFGHAEGDRALIAFANLLKVECSEVDVFARLGGDEFVLLLTNSSKELTKNFVSRLNQSLEKYNHEANCGYAIAFSYGNIEFNSEKDSTIHDMLADGSTTMLEFKKSKRKPLDQ